MNRKPVKNYGIMCNSTHTQQQTHNKHTTNTHTQILLPLKRKQQTKKMYCKTVGSFGCVSSTIKWIGRGLLPTATAADGRRWSGIPAAGATGGAASQQSPVERSVLLRGIGIRRRWFVEARSRSAAAVEQSFGPAGEPAGSLGQQRFGQRAGWAQRSG